MAYLVRRLLENTSSESFLRMSLTGFVERARQMNCSENPLESQDHALFPWKRP